jgi:RNA polymerase sigma factor (sigma-70 family)
MGAPTSSVQTLYADHHNWLLQYLRRRLWSKEQAADLAHDAFIKILLAADPKPIYNPRGYLTVIARQLLADQYEKNSLEQAYLSMQAELPELQVPSEETRAMVLESIRAVDTMLNRLPPPVRSALLLSKLDGLTYDEIALRQGISVRTVKRYMVQAFKACLCVLHERQPDR